MADLFVTSGQIEFAQAPLLLPSLQLLEGGGSLALLARLCPLEPELELDQDQGAHWGRLFWGVTICSLDQQK